MTTFTTWIIPIAWGENKIKKEPLRIFKWKLQYPNNLWPTDINKSVAYMYYYTLNINVLFLLYLRGDVSQEKTFLSLIELKKYIENGHIERKWSSQLTDFIIKLGSCFYERKMEKKTYEWLVPYAKAEPTGSCPKSDAINSPFLSFFFFFRNWSGHRVYFRSQESREKSREYLSKADAPFSYRTPAPPTGTFTVK